MIEDRERWNQRYAADAGCGGDAPSPLLVTELPRLPKGRALDLACGAGRNALHLARNGYEVTGVDIADVALSRAGEQARSEGLDLRWIDADLDTWTLPAAHFDLVVCIQFLDRRLFTEIPRALRPGGAVVFEALLLEPSHPAGAGSGTRFRVQPNELLDAFRSQGFRVLSYYEGARGDRPMASLVGLRPA